MFGLTPRIVRGLIFVSLVNLGVVRMFFRYQIDGALLGFTRPTIALYGLIAAVLALRVTWPQGRTTAGYLLVVLILACLLEASVRSGSVLDGHELLVLMACPLIPALCMIVKAMSGNADPSVGITRASVLVILTWIYVIATMATLGEAGPVLYVHHLVSVNSLTALAVYAASPLVAPEEDSDPWPRRG